MERTRQETIIRTLIDKAIAYGRTRKSSQSGFLHFHNGSSEEAQHLTIPLQNNFLYALALLRSRTVENINEAKEFLEKLLHFQIGIGYADAGAFPIYIHEFPLAKDRYLPVPIGIVVCYILRDYGHVIGQEIRSKLTDALRKLVGYLDNLQPASPPPFRLLVSIGALHSCAGKILGDLPMQDKGESLLSSLEKTPNASWYTPKSLGQVLNSLSLVYQSLEQSPWSELWAFADMSWHRSTGTYVGPPLCQWQVREEPQVTLYDFVMSVQSGFLTKRACRDNRVLLEAATIQLTENVIDPEDKTREWTGVFSGSRWIVHKRPDMAYAAFDGRPEEVHQNQEKGFHQFVMFWGDRDRVHSLGCQRVQPGKVHCVANESGVELSFSLEGGVIEEDRERNREIVVAVDNSLNSSFSVNGENSMIFHLGDCLFINDKIKMIFSLQDGSGKFLGHRMPGNRAAQVGIAESNSFEAYDWLMFLRTVHRTEPCKIVLSIEKLC